MARQETPLSLGEADGHRAELVGPIALALSAFTLAVLPPFLLGGLAIQVRDDLRFGEAALGGCVAAFWAIAAVASASMGRMVERRGADAALRIALLLNMAGLGGVALGARSWPTLVVFMVLCGVANAMIQPAAALYLARNVPSRRRGRAFGFTLAAIPLATLLAGLAVPTFALTVGWRWAFLTGALAALIVRRRVPFPASRSRGVVSSADGRPLRALVVLAVGAALAAAATGCLGSFLVQSATLRGLSEAEAAWWFVAGSVMALSTRLLLGFVAERWGQHQIQLAAAMLIGGAVPIAWLSIGRAYMFGFAAIISFVLAWGWPGLFSLALVELSPVSPAHAMGVAMTGTYLGGVFGPPIFGYVVESASYMAAWLLAAAWAAAAGCVFLGGHRIALRSRLVHESVRWA